MKKMITRALVVLLAILWTLSAGAVVKDGETDEGMNINITPSCIVVGAPLLYVVVNTDLPLADADGAALYLLIDNKPEKVVFCDFTEADAQGELVARFSFESVAGFVGDYDKGVNIWFYVDKGEEKPQSAYDYVMVHDYQKK